MSGIEELFVPEKEISQTHVIDRFVLKQIEIAKEQNDSRFLNTIHNCLYMINYSDEDLSREFERKYEFIRNDLLNQGYERKIQRLEKKHRKQLEDDFLSRVGGIKPLLYKLFPRD